MKFNMETIYIPHASVFDKRDMMFDWEKTSDWSAKLSWFFAIFPVILNLVYYDPLGDFFEFSMWGCVLALVIGGIFCKKWKLWAYYLNVIAFVYCNAIFLYHISDIGVKYSLIMAVADILGLVMVYLNLRCIYNYASVYKALEKEKGFPNFLVNGQDLFADKIYLKDKKQEENQNRETPQNEPIVMNIGVNHSQEEISENQNKKPKHGKSVLGIDIIFPHNDPQDMSFDDKKGYMYYWNSNIELVTRGIFFPVMFMIAGALFCVVAELQGGSVISYIVGNLSVVLLIFGTNSMKMGKLYGAIVTILSLIMYFGLGFFIGAGGNGIPCTWIMITSLLNIKIFLATVRYIINYPMYKELSHHEGFPSFVRNFADIYGDKMYIVEKPEPVKRRILSDNEKIEMNIGYDEKPGKEEKESKGWNAFDYMDKEGKDNNEN